MNPDSVTLVALVSPLCPLETHRVRVFNVTLTLSRHLSTDYMPTGNNGSECPREMKRDPGRFLAQIKKGEENFLTLSL